MSKLIIFVETEQIRAAEKLIACIVNVFFTQIGWYYAMRLDKPTSFRIPTGSIFSFMISITI